MLGWYVFSNTTCKLLNETIVIYYSRIFISRYSLCILCYWSKFSLSQLQAIHSWFDEQHYFAYYIQADVLAHCAPKDLQLSSGALSRVLLNDAGPGLQQELSSVARNGIDYGSVVITQGHNLRCKYVFHGSLPKWGTSSPDPLKVCYCYPTFDK